MRVLVTGGAGFVGSHVVDDLVERGHDVLVVDDLSNGKRRNLNPGARFEQLDVAAPEFLEAARTFRPQVISHLAAQASVSVSMREPLLDARVNVIGGLSVYKAAIESECDQVIYVNTGGALYGEPDYLPCDEEHPIRPVSGYALSKWTSESYFRMLLPESIPLKVLRLANVYGPRQDPHGEAGVIAIFAQAMMEGRQVRIFGDGENMRDYVHVGDVARALRLAMDTSTSLTVNVGTGLGTSVNDIHDRLRMAVGVDSEAVHADPRLGDVRHMVLDCTRARDVLGWQAEIELTDGLQMTIEHMRSSIV